MILWNTFWDPFSKKDQDQYKMVSPTLEAYHGWWHLKAVERSGRTNRDATPFSHCQPSFCPQTESEDSLKTVYITGVPLWGPILSIMITNSPSRSYAFFTGVIQWKRSETLQVLPWHQNCQLIAGIDNWQVANLGKCRYPFQSWKPVAWYTTHTIPPCKLLNWWMPSQRHKLYLEATLGKKQFWIITGDQVTEGHASFPRQPELCTSNMSCISSSKPPPPPQSLPTPLWLLRMFSRKEIRYSFILTV